MNESVLVLFARVEAAIASVGPVAFLDVLSLSAPPGSELERLAASLGADAYVCDASAERAEVGAALALIGFRAADRVVGSSGDVVSGDDLIDLVEAHRWAGVLLAPCLDLVDLAVCRLTAAFSVDPASRDAGACREAFAVGAATAVVFADLVAAARTGS